MGRGRQSGRCVGVERRLFVVIGKPAKSTRRPKRTGPARAKDKETSR